MPVPTFLPLIHKKGTGNEIVKRNSFTYQIVCLMALGTIGKLCALLIYHFCKTKIRNFSRSTCEVVEEWEIET
jgi:hypothetical protein